MPLNCRIAEQAATPPVAWLTGSIDEQAGLGEIFARLAALPGEALVLHTEGVVRVNSIGLLSWIKGLTELTRQRKVAVERLSYALAVHGITVWNFMAGAEVRSCMAPYFCPLCEANHMIVVTRADVQDLDGAPTRKCGDCGSQMEFDELDGYLSILKRA